MSCYNSHAIACFNEFLAKLVVDVHILLGYVETLLQLINAVPKVSDGSNSLPGFCYKDWPVLSIPDFLILYVLHNILHNNYSIWVSWLERSEQASTGRLAALQSESHPWKCFTFTPGSLNACVPSLFGLLCDTTNSHDTDNGNNINNRDRNDDDNDNSQPLTKHKNNSCLLSKSLRSARSAPSLGSLHQFCYDWFPSWGIRRLSRGGVVGCGFLFFSANNLKLKTLCHMLKHFVSSGNSTSNIFQQHWQSFIHQRRSEVLLVSSIHINIIPMKHNETVHENKILQSPLLPTDNVAVHDPF